MHTGNDVIIVLSKERDLVRYGYVRTQSTNKFSKCVCFVNYMKRINL